MHSVYARGQELYFQAREYLDRKDYEQAIPRLKESAAIMPHFKTYELLGECLLTLGNLRESVLYLAASAGLGTRNARARFLLGKALAELGERPDAM